MTGLRRFVGRIRVDLGPRGVGKTSLLRAAERNARKVGAATIWVTAGEDSALLAEIGHELARQTWAKGALSAAGTGSRVREFEQLIREAVRSASDTDHRGLVLFIDEVQSSDPLSLSVLARSWQHLQSEGDDLPVAMFAAGLPDSPETINRAVTFSERFAYRILDLLDNDAVAVALSQPAGDVGVAWDRVAIDLAVERSQGFPYTVQLYGEAAWIAAGYPEAGGRITLDHVVRGEQAVREDLRALFRARWERATSREQSVLQAMATLGDGPVHRKRLASALGLTSNALSVPRGRLIDKGLIYSTGRGELAFSIPGFSEYVREINGIDSEPG